LSDASIAANANILWTKLKGVGTTFKDPAGFADRTSSVISRVDGTRTFSIAPTSGSYSFWANGSEFTKSGTDSVIWPNTEGVSFFYFDTSGVLQTTMSSSVVEGVIQGSGALVAALYWDATNAVSIFFAEERHAFMPQDVHLPWHLAFGAQWVLGSGGQLANITLGTGSSDADAQASVSDFRILDEDLIYSITNGVPQTISPILNSATFYRYGAGGYWRRKTADNFPFIQSGAAGYTGAAGRAAYNQWTGTTWQLTQVGQGNYFGILIFGTNDPQQPVISILGQAEYTTTSAAYSGILSELSNLMGLDSLFAREVVALGAILCQTSSSYINTVKTRFVAADASGSTYIDLRGYKKGSIAGGSSGIALTGTAPVDVTKAAAAAGTSGEAARADHKHDISTFSRRL
jgi:hypothetical protein